MSTTEILFNSPALHSLKRAQLIQLCKRHNIKATGKNTELVDKLKQHALSLKLDQINGESGKENKRSGGEDDDSVIDELDSGVFDKPQRPSEMWEIVMDDIPEEEGGSSNPGSIKSKGSGSLGVGPEFGGTGGSSKSTVSSSIKAFASSLGLKRSMAVSETGTITSTSSRKALSSSNVNVPGQPRDSLLANAIPYASLPSSSSQPLNTEPFAFSYAAHDTSLQFGKECDGEDVSMSSLDRPIPGVGARSGVEVAGLGATAGAGTIRLITSNLPAAGSSSSAGFESPPRLTAMEPTFDLVPPTPGGLNATRWPMTPGKALSPAPWSGLRAREEGAEEWKGIYPSLRNEVVSKDDMDEDVGMPGGLSTPPLQSSPKPPAKTMLSPPRPDVFVFGSPHAKSKADFNKAASSVLAEMNARLGLVGTEAISEDILANRQGGSKMSEEEILNYQFGGSSGTAKDDKNMAQCSSSIKSKFDKAHEKEFAKMESINTHYSLKRGMQGIGNEEQEQLAPLPANRKRKSTVLESSQLKLGHGRPSAALKARRSSNARVISAGTRKKLGMGLPGAFGDDDDDDDDDEDATEERQAKRARPSEAPDKRVSIAPSKDETEKELREREAIRRRLDAQKARRRSSKGRPSVGGPRASLVNQKRLQKPAPTRFGFLTSAAKSLVKSVWNRGAGAPTPAPSALPVPTKATVTQASTSSREKPPIPNAKKPSFASLQKPSRSTTAGSTKQPGDARDLGLQARATRSGTVASVASAKSNTSVVTTRETSGPRSRSPIPPFETNEGDRKGSVSSKVSSVGTGSRANRASVVSAASSSAPRRVRPSSTLLAPTASSLAKTNVRRPLPVPPVQTAVHSSHTSHQVVSPATASPSKIPVILPLSPRKKSLYSGATSPASPSEKKTSIFSTPLVAPTTPGVNPITGQASPSRIPLAANTSHQNATAVQRGPSVQRKPRISRSKVIAKLGAQRAASSTYSTTTQTSGEGDTSSSQNQTAEASVGNQQQGLGPVVRNKQRTRSSIGTSSRRIRSSAGGVKAAAGIGSRGSGVGLGGASGVLMSAKRRARASEYARRRSEKTRAMPGLQVSNSGDDEGEGGMEVDA